MNLKEALRDLLWINHSVGDLYTVDGKGEWEIVYYPIMANGETQEPYDEPRALMQTIKKFNGVEGFDFREMPLRYVKRIK